MPVIVVYIGCKMRQMDVKYAFLNRPLNEDVYVEKPPDFKLKGKEKEMYILRKYLYGLKQTPKEWNKLIHIFLIKLGINKCTLEPKMYVKGSSENEQIILCLDEDDILVNKNN